MGKAKTSCVLMTGPDDQMDHVGDRRKSANPLPVRCKHCSFPDIDAVAKPYLLARGMASPAETSPAALGNFLVRERARRILELVAPGACEFHPTAEFKSRKVTDWWLAVPKVAMETNEPKVKVPVCSKCGEPKARDFARGDIWREMTQFDGGGTDVFKTVAWHSQETLEDMVAETNQYREKDGLPPVDTKTYGVELPMHAERWTRRTLARDLYFSVRLEQLFKRAKVKGQLMRLFAFEGVQPSTEDEQWIAAKLELLGSQGLVEAPKAGKKKPAANKWFQDFLKRKARKGGKPVDASIVEKKQKLVLPHDYKDFISTVGPMVFEDVNDTEGFTVRLLPPEKLDFKEYRRGKMKYLEGEDVKVDGVMFASTDHGDAFVFDVSSGKGDYPVYWYGHEGNAMNAFAPDFAACIKRFEEKN